MAGKKETNTLTGDRRARAECFILCDYARAENNKLYIVGGGWDQIVPLRLPLDYEAYLAIKLVLEWTLFTDPGSIVVRAELLDTNDQVLGDPIFEVALEGRPVDVPEEMQGQGRLMLALFMGQEAKMTLTEPGLYALRLLVNDEAIATTDFRVAPPRSQLHQPDTSQVEAIPKTT